MRFKKFIILLVVTALSACDESGATNNGSPIAESSPGIVTPILVPAPQQELDTSIRNVDFGNFEYTGPEDYRETFTLKNGEKPLVFHKEDGISLSQVDYHDVTGDGREEAIVRMGIQTGGTALSSLVFIYKLVDKKPIALWKFISGDRAEGGLKDVYSKEGFLIVELFGENKLVNGKWESRSPEGSLKGLCCPTVFTRTKLKWGGKEFGVSGVPDVFDLDNASTQGR